MGTALRQRQVGAQQPIIGVDCDGVLASDRLLWQRLHERFPAHIPARYEDLATFEWPRATAESAALCLELSADPQFMARLAPMPRMAAGLRHLHQRGYRLHVITARPDCVRRATRRWLRRQGVADYVEAIHCVADGPAKVPLALALGCAAFVEDNYATAEALGKAGVRSYLLDAPYNRLPTQASVRVRDWRALLADLAIAMPARHPAAPPVEVDRRLVIPSIPVAGLPAAALAS
jgi:uncharacterized HAD superfamily protein